MSQTQDQQRFTIS